jgi:hypothetical protein
LPASIDRRPCGRRRDIGKLFNPIAC